MGLFQRKSKSFTEANDYSYEFSDGQEIENISPPPTNDFIANSPKSPLSATEDKQSATNNARDFNAPKENTGEEFGVTELVNLFHSLPQRNFEAEISAAVRTIASYDINVENLIDDLVTQENLAKKRVKVLELEIELFKAKIRNRKKELDLLHIGISELTKSKDYLQQGLSGVSKEEIAFTQRLKKKKAANLKKKTEQNNLIPLAERITLATHKELEQLNPQSKIQTLRNKFKRRLMRD